MDQRTGLGRRPGQTQRKFQRMQTATPAIQHPGLIVGPQQLAQLGPAMAAQLVIESYRVLWRPFRLSQAAMV